MQASHRGSPTLYRHTQFGLLPFILWSIVTAFCVAIGVMSHMALFWLVGAVTALVALGMSSLTTVVSAREVELFFGPKLFRRRIPLAEIGTAEVARSSPLEGWGIRITGDGWLFNVTGDQAVRIHLRSGGNVRVGTDDATGLAAAIVRGVADHDAPGPSTP